VRVQFKQTDIFVFKKEAHDNQMKHIEIDIDIREQHKQKKAVVKRKDLFFFPSVLSRSICFCYASHFFVCHHSHLYDRHRVITIGTFNFVSSFFPFFYIEIYYLNSYIYLLLQGALVLLYSY